MSSGSVSTLLGWAVPPKYASLPLHRLFELNQFELKVGDPREASLQTAGDGWTRRRKERIIYTKAQHIHTDTTGVA